MCDISDIEVTQSPHYLTMQNIQGTLILFVSYKTLWRVLVPDDRFDRQILRGQQGQLTKSCFDFTSRNIQWEWAACPQENIITEFVPVDDVECLATIEGV